MQPPHILVVSDPPHDDVDAEAVARVLGLDASDMRLKLEFGAPEVLSSSNHHRASEIMDTLLEAGMSVAAIDAQRLTKVPWPTSASSVEYGPDALVARVAGADIRLAYDAPVVAVACIPPADLVTPPSADGNAPDADGSASTRDRDAVRGAYAPLGGAGARRAAEGRALAEAVEWLPHFDLYFEDDVGTPRRVCIAPSLTATPTMGAADLPSLIADCANRFTSLRLDRRLEGVRPRQRFVMGEQGYDIDLRKLYSFGTLLLRQALDQVDPELKDLTQYELGSRLSYVLRWDEL